MTIDERQVSPGTPEDLSDLLSEVRHADMLANDSCTREFLQAGERLLHDVLVRDAEDRPGRGRVPFDELLACVSRRQVVDEAEGSWARPGGKAGKWFAKLFGEEPGQQLYDDLRRVKSLIETGEVAQTPGSSSVFQPAQPLAGGRRRAAGGRR